MQVIQLYIEGERVDMFADESVNITQTIQNVKDISKIFTDFSKTFTLPASKTNNKIFEHYYNYNIVNGFDARTKKNSYIELNHKPFRKGKIKLEGVDLKENKPYAYRITFFGNTVDLKDLLGEDTLSSLDWLNNFNQNYSASAVRTGLTTGYNKTVGGVTYNKAVVAPLITHTTRLYYNSDNSDHAEYPDPNGGNLYAHGSHHHGVYYEELKYALKLHLIVKAIEETYGIQFSEDFFASDNAAYYDLYFWLHRKKGKAFDSSAVTYQVINFPLLLGEMIGVNCYPDKLLIFGQSRGITYNLVITSTTANPYTVIIKKDGQIFDQKTVTAGSTSLQGILTNSSTGYTVFIQTGTSMTNVVADWQLESIQYPEAYNYTTDQFTIPLTQEFIITEQIPDIKVIDFLTGVFKMFNLTAYEKDGIIIVRTLDSFYESSTTTWDITDYVDVNTGTVDTALPYKRIDFKYENLDTKLSKQHEQISLNGWGTVKYDGGDNFDAGGDIYSVVAPFEHMKYERLIDLNTETIKTPQVGWFVDDNNDPYYGNPLLTYAISVTGDTIRFLNTETGAGGTFNDITTYYIPSNSVALSAATSTDNIHFNLEVNEYTFGNDFTNTLFNKYYNTYISEVFNSKRRITKVKAFLPINFLINYSLADQIKIGDKVYIINSINSNLLNGESNLELLNVVGALNGGETPSLLDATVSTLAGTATDTTFTMNGQVTFEGLEPYTERGFYWVQGTGNPIGGTKVIVSGSGTSTYSATVTGRTPETTYSYIAYVINNGTTKYGTPARQVTTAATLSTPTVVTNATSNVSYFLATFNGTIVDVGDPPYTEKGFVWVVGTGTPTTSNNKEIVSGTSAGSYSNTYSLPSANQTYTVRAYAINTQGTAYGANNSFTTLELPRTASVSTLDATNVDETTARLNGNITDVGNPNYTSKGFYWKLGTSTPTASDNVVNVSGTSAGTYDSLISGLSDGSTYSFVAWVTNSQGTTTGVRKQFTTSVIPETCDGGTLFFNSSVITGMNATLQTGNVSYNTGQCSATIPTVDLILSNNEGEWVSASQVTDIQLFEGGTNVTSSYTLGKYLSGDVMHITLDGNFPNLFNDGDHYYEFRITAYNIATLTTTITLPPSNAVNHASVNVVANGSTSFPASRNDTSYNNGVLYPTGQDGDAYEYTVTYTADAGYEFTGIGNVTLSGTTGAGVNQIQDSYTSSTYVIKVYGTIQSTDITGSASWSGSAIATPATSVAIQYRFAGQSTWNAIPSAGIDIGTGGVNVELKVTPNGSWYAEPSAVNLITSYTPEFDYSGDEIIMTVNIRTFGGAEPTQATLLRFYPRASTTSLTSVRFQYYEAI